MTYTQAYTYRHTNKDTVHTKSYMHLTFDQMSSGFHHNFCPEGPTNFHQLQNSWMPGPAVRSVATSHWSVPRPAGISYPEMPWKNRQSWHNRNRLHLHLWVSFSKLSILLLHLLRSQGDETMKGSVGQRSVSGAQNHLPRSKKLRSNNRNDLQFQNLQVSCILARVFRSLAGPNGDGGGGTPWTHWPMTNCWPPMGSYVHPTFGGWRFRCCESNIGTKKPVDLTKITSQTKRIHQPFTTTKKTAKVPHAKFRVPPTPRDGRLALRLPIAAGTLTKKKQQPR